MFYELKRKGRKRFIVEMIAAILLFVIFFTISGIPFNLVGYMKGLQEFDYEKIDTYTNEYVKIETEYIMDYFAEYDSNQYRYYPIVIYDKNDNPIVMGAELYRSDYKEMQNIIDNTENYMSTGEGDNSIQPAVLKGSVRPMTIDEEQYFRSYFEGSDFQLSPYIITNGETSDISVLWQIIWGIFAGMFLLFVICKCISYTIKVNEIALKRAVEARYGLGSYEESESDFRDAVNIGDIYIGNRWIYFTGGRIDVYHSDDVVWVYKHITNHKVNFVTVGYSYAIVINMNDRKKFTFPLKKEADFEIISGHLYNKNIGIIFGFDKELQKLYGTNINQFMDMYNKRKEGLLRGQQGIYQQDMSR